MQKPDLYYSVKCKHCNNIMSQMQSCGVLENMNLHRVDQMSINQIPSDVKSVPTIKMNDITLCGRNAFMWINDIKMKSEKQTIQIQEEPKQVTHGVVSSETKSSDVTDELIGMSFNSAGNDYSSLDDSEPFNSMQYEKFSILNDDVKSVEKSNEIKPILPKENYTLPDKHKEMESKYDKLLKERQIEINA